MGKSAPTPPPAPDPTAVAGAQSAANINTAIAQGVMNHTNQNTPYGSINYTQSGTQDVGGNAVPQYTANVTLNPQQQAALDQQQQLTTGLYGLSNDQLGRIGQAVSQPFSTSGLPSLSTGLDTTGLPQMRSSIDTSGLPQMKSQIDASGLMGIPDPNALNQRGIDAVYNQATSRLDPQWQQSEAKMQSQLADQGIPQGSAAYNQAFDNFNRAKTDAYSTAQNTAVTTGAQIAGQQFGQALAGRGQQVGEQMDTAGLAQQMRQQGVSEQQIQAQLAQVMRQQGVSEQQIQAQLAQTARQQGIQEQSFMREQPLNEAIALMGGGQIQNPQFAATPQSNVAPTNVIDAYSLNQAAQNNAYNQQNLNYQGFQSGLFGLGTAGIMGGLGGAFSPMRR